MDEIKKGRYKHFKGNEYEVLCIAEHSETKEELVIYKSIQSGVIHARPIKMFLERINVDGNVIPRFTFIE